MTTTISPLAQMLADDATVTAQLTATRAFISDYDRDLISLAKTMAAAATLQAKRTILRSKNDRYADDPDTEIVRAAFTGRLKAVTAELARMTERQALEIATLKAEAAK